MTESSTPDIDQIGDAAGMIWSYLNDNGASSLNKLTKNLEVSRELTLQAIGWLAREDKLVFEQATRGRLIRLKLLD